MRSIDKAWAVARAQNLPFASEYLDLGKFGLGAINLSSQEYLFYVWLLFGSMQRLWLQGDNACKEVRNSFTGRWCTLLTQASYFQSAGHHHMEVGHTHEDIGWWFIKMHKKTINYIIHHFFDEDNHGGSRKL